jgi:hypothetical protein
VGKGADFVVEAGCFRAERHGDIVELMERQGSYRLSLMSKHDRDSLRKLLDLVEREEAGLTVLALGERGRKLA